MNPDFTFLASGLMFISTGWVAVLCDHGLTNDAFSFSCCDEMSKFRHCYIMFTIWSSCLVPCQYRPNPAFSGLDVVLISMVSMNVLLVGCI